MNKKRINIINFDSIVNETPPKYNVEQLKSPNSIIINAPRQSGKTNLLLNLLVGENGDPLLYYDKIFIMSLSKTQKKYKFLVDYFEELAEETNKELNKKKNKNDDSQNKTLNNTMQKNKNINEEQTKVKSILSITNKWEELPQMEERKHDDNEEGEHYLVIFDDVLKLYDKDAKFRNFVDTLYIAGRHSRNPISPCFITQSYCDLDSSLRKNTSHTFLLGFATRPLLNTLAGAIPICDYKTYRDIFKKNIDYPWDFVLINTNEVDLDKKIWVNQMNESVPIKESLKNSL